MGFVIFIRFFVMVIGIICYNKVVKFYVYLFYYDIFDSFLLIKIKIS